MSFRNSAPKLWRRKANRQSSVLVVEMGTRQLLLHQFWRAVLFFPCPYNGQCPMLRHLCVLLLLQDSASPIRLQAERLNRLRLYSFHLLRVRMETGVARHPATPQACHTSLPIRSHRGAFLKPLASMRLFKNLLALLPFLLSRAVGPRLLCLHCHRKRCLLRGRRAPPPVDRDPRLLAHKREAQ